MSNPSTAQDPAAAALTAIEDALKLQPEPEGKPEGKPARAKPARWNSACRAEARKRRAPRRSISTSPPPRRSDAPLSPGGAPANDDRESVGHLLQSMQVKADSTSMTVAVLAAALWSGLWIGYAIFTKGEVFTGNIFNPAAAMAVFALIGPVIFFIAMGW